MKQTLVGHAPRFKISGETPGAATGGIACSFWLHAERASHFQEEEDSRRDKKSLQQEGDAYNLRQCTAPMAHF
eukprot:1161970-Pelagomonas_calceolata.AAC.2